jgi:hypothetical protein
MSESQFIREIDEELRHDRLMKLWTNYGGHFVGAALLIIAATGGWRAWEWYQAHEAEKVGTIYEEALTLADAGDRTTAEEKLSFVLKDAPAGYRLLARFRLAAETGAGDVNAGVNAYDAIAADTSIDTPIRDLARVRAALLLVDTAPVSEIVSRVERLSAEGSPFKYSAKEILGLARYRAGERSAARIIFSQLAVDAEAPLGVRNRAEVMSALLADAELPGKPNSATQ